MIDTAHVRIPQLTPFVPEMRETSKIMRWGRGPFRPSRFYTCVGDLRESHGIDAILHFELKQGEERSHKIEIIDSGKKTLKDMEGIITSVFEVDPKELKLMRLDCTADVEGTPVPWFRESARFRFKRFSSQIDKAEEKKELEFVGMGTADSQSLYAGRRPNCVRIYNKFDELRRQWLKLKRAYEKYNRGLGCFELTKEQYETALRVPPSFEEFCLKEGFTYSKGAILTRVERQIGGDRFPRRCKRSALFTKLTGSIRSRICALHHRLLRFARLIRRPKQRLYVTYLQPGAIRRSSGIWAVSNKPILSSRSARMVTASASSKACNRSWRCSGLRSQKKKS